MATLHFTAYTEAFETEKDVAISAFLRYISKRIPTDSFTEKLDGLVEKAKDNQKLRSEYLAMNLHDRDIKKQAYKEGALQKALETARNMLADGISVDSVSKYSGLPLETVKELAKEVK